MQVMFACLADYASVVQPGNKLNVSGIFDRIVSRSYPAGHGPVFLVSRLRLEY